MKIGYFSFVLHSHLPYVRRAGRWPHGEEMIHEAIAETYLPLLTAIDELKAEGVEPQLTVGITPILAEQLADPEVLDHFELYAEERFELASTDRDRFNHAGREDLARLAKFYVQCYRTALDRFRLTYKRDLIGAFRRLQESGNVELITSAATHGYLPLLDRDSSIRGQLRTGVASYRRHFGRDPRGIWLPECGYRPAYWEGATLRPGLEQFLAELNLTYFITDTPVITGGQMIGKIVGDVAGPYGGLPERTLVREPTPVPVTGRTTFRPYYVEGANVAVFGRDERTGVQVWSASQGYPGDFLYREFHRKDPVSGLQYYRVTDASGDLSGKQLYDPERAQTQVRIHAEHFVHLVEARLAEYQAGEGRPGIIVSAYDSELFGHWWFEGVDWLKAVLRGLARSERVELITATDYLRLDPPDEVLTLPESSWGTGGNHYTWHNERTEWMWPLIHNAERTMERLASSQTADRQQAQVLAQAARELLLLESSDWPFLVSTGQAADYATSRFQSHLARFNHLATMAAHETQSGTDLAFLTTSHELDNPFPAIDIRDFAPSQAISAPDLSDLSAK